MEAHGGIVSRSFLEKLCIPKFIIDGMFIKGNYYHPTFLYESFFNLLVLIFIFIIRRHKKFHEGMVLSIYMICYGIIRFFVESLRTDSLMLGSIRVAQLISTLLFVGGIVLLIYSIKKNKYYNADLVDKNDNQIEKKEESKEKVNNKKKTTVKKGNKKNKK